VVDRPAGAGELRGLRRWLIVAAVWATAATAIAVIALIAATDARDDNTEAGRRSARTADQISRAQRQLNGRLEELESGMEELPSAGEVAGLGNRMERAEATDERAGNQLDELTASIADLEKRVESLEKAPAGSGGGGETPP
jgi:chromosome segregation ATPase